MFSEASNFADQSGVFEIHDTMDAQHKLAMRQVVPEYPLIWCPDAEVPVSVIGNGDWKDATFSIDSMIDQNQGGVFIAFRVNKGGCSTRSAKGVFFWVNTNGTFMVTSDLEHKNVLTKGMTSVAKPKQWFTLKMQVEGSQATGYLNGKQAFSTKIPAPPRNGFIAMGTADFTTGYWFDNFSITKAS